MERRDTFRIPLSGEAAQCSVRVNGTVVFGQLTEESAGGFTVFFDSIEGINRDDIGVLSSQRGDFKVRVAHVSAVANGVSVGMERMSEISARVVTPRQSNGKIKRRIVKTLVVILVASTTIGAQLWFGRGDHEAVKPTAVDQDGGKAVQRFIALRRLVGPSASKTVQLSWKQQRSVVAVAHRALSELQILENSRGNVADAELADLSLQVIYLATDEIDKMLDERQRTAWKEFDQDQNISQDTNNKPSPD